jgi:hypothetical protein
MAPTGQTLPPADIDRNGRPTSRRNHRFIGMRSQMESLRLQIRDPKARADIEDNLRRTSARCSAGRRC